MTLLSPVVSTEWLAQHLGESDVHVIEADLTPDDYESGHIPGATFWHPLTDVLRPDMSVSNDPAHLAALLGRSGVVPGATLIFVSNYPANMTFLFWFLSLCGVESHVLDGGKPKWRTEGRPLSQQSETPLPVEWQVASLPSPDRAWRDDVEEAQRDSHTLILDVRTPEEYEGLLYMTEPPLQGQRAGHIPGALHLGFETALNEDGTFKSAQELRALYEGCGVTMDKTIIPYCTVGARSSHNWFVLKRLLHYPRVLNYDGSWREWSAYDGVRGA